MEAVGEGSRSTSRSKTGEGREPRRDCWVCPWGTGTKGGEKLEQGEACLRLQIVFFRLSIVRGKTFLF